MVEGQPAGHVLRSCFIGMNVAERLQLSEEERSALFYALLLKDAGCSSNSSKVAALFESDDLQVKRALKTVDWSRLPKTFVYMVRNVSPEGSLVRDGEEAPGADLRRAHARGAVLEHRRHGRQPTREAGRLGLPPGRNRIASVAAPRILGVADIFNALSQDRPYREAILMEKILGIIGKESEEKLSPESVEALGELVSKGEL